MKKRKEKKRIIILQTFETQKTNLENGVNFKGKF